VTGRSGTSRDGSSEERRACEMAKVYKGLEVYCCLALNRIASQLDIDLQQTDLEEKIDALMQDGGRNPGVPKVEISYELHANHHMTNKVLESLEADGLIAIDKDEGGGREYKVKITKDGVLHLRKYNEFYSVIFKRYILDHYKYSRLPAWFVQ
jgi:predicted transcriptional regulator